MGSASTGPASAWQELCARLAAAGERIEARSTCPAEALEGARHLSHLAESALRWFVGYDDPVRPRLVNIDDTAEVANNRFAAVTPEGTYRISGNVAGLDEVNISVHDGWSFTGKSQVWGDLGFRDLRVADDGTFEVILGGPARPVNWIALPPEAAFVQVREYFFDWHGGTPATLIIERIDDGRDRRDAGSAGTLRHQLDQAGTWVEGYLDTHYRLVTEQFAATPNRLARTAHAPAGNRNIAYGPGSFELAPDEALLVEFERPDAAFWSLQWLQWPWYENPDIATRLSGLPSGEASADPDGRVRVVVSGQDIGAPNWLDVAGRQRGVLMFRLFWPDRMAAPSCRRLPAGDAWSSLHHAAVAVTGAERQATLDRRRAHFTHRGR
jgi:hypothetical protein